ncbi:MAG: PIN domain-containing protein [Planctomycetia bacterium]|nr:PIN domain-containing protein [Planctomycetia bacterium]
MDRALLDTDIFSEILKAKNATVAAKGQEYRDTYGLFTISAVTIMEIIKGLRKLGQPERLRSFLDAVSGDEVLPLDMASAEVAGKIHGDLERAGQTIGRADPMVAGIAIHHGLVLVSGNTAHYERIRALGYPLQLDNWRA